ncbi:PAS domain-containing protein [Leptolyngbya sp. AN02str]|uniref:PAS domain-containing protein n=1 Tax=Leptolyngbya sp. AN02str TaxID=3423363 RepID=UPI003D313C39
MNIDSIHCSGRASVSFGDRVSTALGRLQPQTNSNLSGSVYIYDLVEQHTLYSSCLVTDLLGYTSTPAQTKRLLNLACLIHPDDLAPVAEHFQRFTTLQPEEVITLDYRMQLANGDWCWLRSQETPLVQASDGFPLQILGMLHIQSKPPSPHLASSGKPQPQRTVETIQYRRETILAVTSLSIPILNLFLF